MQSLEEDEFARNYRLADRLNRIHISMDYDSLWHQHRFIRATQTKNPLSASKSTQQNQTFNSTAESVI